MPPPSKLTRGAHAAWGHVLSYAPKIASTSSFGAATPHGDRSEMSIAHTHPPPLLSVTLAAYHVAPWVGATLDSVRTQTFGDWECVAIDDGSLDETGRLLDEAVRRDARFRVTHQTNNGVSSARNRGVTSARGVWVGFLDGDDAVAPWWLASVAAAIQIPGLSLVRHGFRVWRGGALPHVQQTTGHSLFTGQTQIHRWGWLAFAVEGFSWRCFVRREIARRVRFILGLPLQEDSVYGFDLLPHLRGVCDLRATPHFYRRRRGSVLHSACPVKVPLMLLQQARRVLTHPFPCDAACERERALAFFVFHAVTDWALRPKGSESNRFSEVRVALTAFIDDGIFTFRQLVPLWWRPSTWLFLRIGWLWPMCIGGVCACVMFKLRQHLHLGDTP